ncbi:MAG: anti-sigma factor [Betaproteobacteria bacterium]
MNLDRPDRAARLDALAAAYALGTLNGRARRRLARIALSSPGVAAAVEGWGWRLAALTDGMPGITPPPRVWTGIRARLGLSDPTAAKDSAPWWASLSLWRGLAFAGFALAFALGVTVLAPTSERPFESVVVVLAGPDAKPALVATAERGSRFLTVKAVAPVDLPGGRALELWMLPDGRAPVSMGLVPASGIDRLALRAPVGVALQGIPALAVSIEPAGGSPTGAPTGPVVYTGRVERFY